MGRRRGDDSVISEGGHPPNQTSAVMRTCLFEAERQTGVWGFTSSVIAGSTPALPTLRVLTATLPTHSSHARLR